MAKIRASNGQEYDLANLSPADKSILQSLGHLPKDEAKKAAAPVEPATTEGAKESKPK